MFENQEAAGVMAHCYERKLCVQDMRNGVCLRREKLENYTGNISIVL